MKSALMRQLFERLPGGFSYRFFQWNGFRWRMQGVENRVFDGLFDRRLHDFDRSRRAGVGEFVYLWRTSCEGGLRSQLHRLGFGPVGLECLNHLLDDIR